MSAPVPPGPDVAVDHVLVPLDGSELALAALPTARALAARFGARLHTVSVARDATEAPRLRSLAAAALGVGLDDPQLHVVVGDDPAASIVGQAEQLDRSVVCLSSHGRGRLSGAVIGSVARSILQRTPRPLVVLGPNADRPLWFPVRSWPEPLSVPRIVACVDGSRASEAVLPVSAGWARALGAELTILTVVQDTPEPLRPREPAEHYLPTGDPQTYLEELVGRWRTSAPEVTVVRQADPLSPASGVRAHLEEAPAGLVALTAHAREGWSRVALGAAAADITYASTVPCLIVPAGQ